MKKCTDGKQQNGNSGICLHIKFFLLNAIVKSSCTQLISFHVITLQQLEKKRCILLIKNCIVD